MKVGEVISVAPTTTLKAAYHRGRRQLRSIVKTKLLSYSSAGGILVPRKEKSVFGVSIYFDDERFSSMSWALQRYIGGHLKHELAKKNLKARFMGFPRSRRLPQLTNVEVLKKRLVEESVELLCCVDNKRSFLAKNISNHNPFDFQKRDVKRPVQRKIFSIPPRLAKIMVNLSLCTRGKTLLDPFCGVGTILQEAVLAEAQVIGVDINPWCVDASIANLEWLKNEYELGNLSPKIAQGDAAEMSNLVEGEAVDCIATEPDLGPALRCFPTERYAMKIITKLEPLYYDFLIEAHRVLRNDGRLVLVAPCVRTRSGRFISMDLEEKAQNIGFKIIEPFVEGSFASDLPVAEELLKTSDLVDLGERHKIGRRILIFEK